jgi:2-iminobutanoate/2-iminopropanoate deaminase
LNNVKAIIEAAGTSMQSVVRTTVYLTRPEHFASMNEVYAHYFDDEPPARVTVFVSSMAKSALVEIDAIAKIS